MRITDTSDLWWKTAVVYCLDVETFLDAFGERVLPQLGVTAPAPAQAIDPPGPGGPWRPKEQPLQSSMV